MQPGSRPLELNDLLSDEGIDSRISRVLVMRHAPPEVELRRVLPLFAVNQPETYNAYQQCQRPKEEKQLSRADYLVSCIGHEPKAALFVGVYKTMGACNMTLNEVAEHLAIQRLMQLGMNFFRAGEKPEDYCLWFNLEVEPAFEEWKGKLVLDWPPMERNWSRWADRNRFLINAVHDCSILVG